MIVRQLTAVLFAALLTTVGLFAPPAAGETAGSAGTPVAPRAADPTSGGSVRFEQNLGQVDAGVSFLARASGTTTYFTEQEIVMTIPAPSAQSNRSHESGLGSFGDAPESPPSVVRMKLVGASLTPEIAASNPLPGRSHYFIGNQASKWITDVPSYGRIVYDDVYPGIDLAYYGAADGRLEHDFLVAPGADPRLIRWSFTGATLSLTPAGALAIGTDAGTLEFEAPRLHQTIGGEKKTVAGSFKLDASGEARYEIGAYDATVALVIDPVMGWSTYLGASGFDEGHDVVIDANGDVYVAGHTAALSFPRPAGSPAFTVGDDDAFVAKFTSQGVLVYATQIGGNHPLSTQSGGNRGDGAWATAVDAAGSAYVTGATFSADFPMVGAYQGKSADMDSFVAKLSPAGNAIVYSTYLGGNGNDWGWGLDVTPNGYAYVAGFTSSSNYSVLPNGVMKNPYQASNKGDDDVFVTKLAISGSSLEYSTYLGGTGSDRALAIDVDASGTAYVTGVTSSSGTPANAFPTTNANQPANAGGKDAFVAKLSFAGSALSLDASTYLGGAGDDYGYGIAVGPGASAFVAGSTTSASFPGADPATYAGDADAFLAKLTFTGANVALGYSNYLGGTGPDYAYAVAATPSGIAYVTGGTGSSTTFPLLGAIQPAYGGGPSDAFVAQYSSAGVRGYSSFLGGTQAQEGYDAGFGIATDSACRAYVTGRTDSGNFPTLSPLSGQSGYHGGRDGFASAFVDDAAAPLCVVPPCAVDDDGNGVIGPGESECDPCDFNHDGTVDPGEEARCNPPPPAPLCVNGEPSFLIRFWTGSATGLVEDALGQADVHWRVESAPAPVASPGTPESIARHASWAMDSPSRNWINALDDATDPSNAQPGGSGAAPLGAYVYAYDFTLPAGATNLALSMKHAADDSIALSLNNHAPFATAANAGALAAAQDTNQADFAAGLNTLRATVTNSVGAGGVRMTGLLAEGEITGDCPTVKAPIPCDADGDGDITPEEALACCERLECDTNGDKIVDSEEREDCENCANLTAASGTGPVTVNTVVLYENDFESPHLDPASSTCGPQLSAHPVNTLYGPGWLQTATVETILIHDAAGLYTDPSGIGGNHSIAGGPSADLAGLTFNPGTRPYVNVAFDLASIRMTNCGLPPGTTLVPPVMTVKACPSTTTLVTCGPSTWLDGKTVTGALTNPSAVYEFQWARHVVPLHVAGTGVPILIVFDFDVSLYSTIDNLVIAASTTMGDVEGNACDTNRDGIVDKAELAACCGNPCDTDRNGELSDAEREACEDGDDCIHPCDSNRDGRVDRDERARCERGFEPCDKNRDGRLSDREREVCKGLYAACDADLDGVTTPEEAERCKDRRVHPCDRDADGAVDASELARCKEGFEPCDTDRNGALDEAEKRVCEGAFLACDADMNGFLDEEERESCECFDECDANRDGVVDEAEARLCNGNATFHPCDRNLDGLVDADEKKACSEVFHSCDTNLDGRVDAAEKRACLSGPRAAITKPADRSIDDIATRLDETGVWILVEGALSSGALASRIPDDLRLDAIVSRAGASDVAFTVKIEGREVVSVATPAEEGEAKYTLSMSEPAALSILNSFDRARTAGLLFAEGYLAVNGASQADKAALKTASSGVAASFLDAQPYREGETVGFGGGSATLASGGGGAAAFLAAFDTRTFLVDAHGGRIGYVPGKPASTAGGPLSPTSGLTSNTPEARREIVASDPDLRNAAAAFEKRDASAFFRAAERADGSGASPPSAAFACAPAAPGAPSIFDRWGNMKTSGFTLGAGSTEALKAKACGPGLVPAGGK